MGVEIKRSMEKDESGVDRQVYYITNIEAVEGLAEALAGNKLVIGVNSVNGRTGNITLTAADLPLATAEQDGIITAEMYEKIIKLLESGGD